MNVEYLEQFSAIGLSSDTRTMLATLAPETHELCPVGLCFQAMAFSLVVLQATFERGSVLVYLGYEAIQCVILLPSNEAALFVL